MFSTLSIPAWTLSLTINFHVGLYLYALLMSHIWYLDEDDCQKSLYTVAWWLVMMPWLIVGCTCCCTCCCIAGIAYR